MSLVHTSLIVALVSAAPVYLPSSLDAQFIDPDRCLTCVDKMEHAAAGAGIALLARGPWITSSWRDCAWKRIGWAAAIGAGYELLQYFEHKADGRLGRPGFGFSPHDLVADIVGAIAIELVIATAYWLW